MNNSLDNLLDVLKLLGQNIGNLNDGIGRLTVSIQAGADIAEGFFNTLKISDTAHNYSLAGSKRIVFEDSQRVKKDTLHQESDQYMKTASSIGELAKNGIELYEVFGKLSPELEKVKKGVSAFNGGIQALEGVEALAESTELTSGISAISSVLAGIEEIGALAIPFGPVGWIIGGGALLAGGIAAVSLNEALLKNENKTPQTFADVAKNNNNSFLQRAENATLSAADYIKTAETPEDKSVNQITAEVQKLKAVFLTQATIPFDYKKAQSHDPVYLQALVSALNENDHLHNNTIKQVLFDSEDDKNAFKNRFDKFGHFPLRSTPGIEETYLFYSPHRADGPGISTVYKRTISRKEYQMRLENESGKGFSPLRLLQENVLLNAVQSYLSNGFEYVRKEYEKNLAAYPGTKSQADQLWRRFLTVKQVIDNKRKFQGSVYETGSISKQNEQNGNPHSSDGNARIININLNKPMIEHFTINTNGTKDGLRDFKHKVEEVLLEILNSANTI